jgi:hypothetical protein
MAEVNADKLKRAYNLLTGWRNKMEQAADGDGIITVNRCDVAEIDHCGKIFARTDVVCRPRHEDT